MNDYLEPIENLSEKHFELLEREYGCSKDRLYELIEQEGDEFESLLDGLAIDEPDDEDVEAILDAICDCFESPEPEEV